MKKITIIMPYLNEGEEVINTINSIYETADKSLFNIIAIDDGSKDTYNLSMYPEVKYVKNHQRIGVDASRQIGIEMAETPYVFVVDSHMRFKNDNWLLKIIDCLDRESNTLWCTTCVGLGYGSMDMAKNKGLYYGADMLLIDAKADPNRVSRECIEPKWASKKEGIEYEVACILGANYGIDKKWFMHIRGLKGLRMWGSSEPFLSMKSWLAGGKCKIRTDIEIGHKFRDNAPYVTPIAPLYANKMYICKSIFPNELGDRIINCLPKNVNFKMAQEIIEKDKDKIEEDRKYYQSIFKRTIYDYCNEFHISV